MRLAIRSYLGSLGARSLQAAVVILAQACPGPFTEPRARQVLRTTRRVAIPLLE